MSTRCNVVVKDEYQSIQLYKHYDGYPENMLPLIQKSTALAWDLPRFEADDFAAAFVATAKTGSGDVYIDGDHQGQESLHGDIDYLYIVKQGAEGVPMIEVYELHYMQDFPTTPAQVVPLVPTTTE